LRDREGEREEEIEKKIYSDGMIARQRRRGRGRVI
jgi:hypothetical protein